MTFTFGAQLGGLPESTRVLEPLETGGGGRTAMLSDSQASRKMRAHGLSRFGTHTTSLGLDTMNTEIVSNTTLSSMLLECAFPPSE